MRGEGKGDDGEGKEKKKEREDKGGKKMSPKKTSACGELAHSEFLFGSQHSTKNI